MSTVTFSLPLGSVAGIEPFPPRLPMLPASRTALAFSVGGTLSRGVAVQAALMPGTTAAGQPVQIRAIECLRIGPQVDASGVRRMLTSLDLLRMVSDFDTRGLPAPLYAGPASYAADRKCVGVVLGLLIIGSRLFAVIAVNDSLVLEVEAKECAAVSTEVESVIDAETHSGVRHRFVGVFLVREAAMHMALSRFVWKEPDHAVAGFSHGLRGRCLSLAHSR